MGRRALLGPGQRLRGRIDLVVVAGVREQHEFGEIKGQLGGAKGGGLGKIDEAVLDRRGLREEAHDLVAAVIAEGIAILAVRGYSLLFGGKRHLRQFGPANLRAHENG